MPSSTAWLSSASYCHTYQSPRGPQSLLAFSSLNPSTLLSHSCPIRAIFLWHHLKLPFVAQEFASEEDMDKGNICVYVTASTHDGSVCAGADRLHVHVHGVRQCVHALHSYTQISAHVCACMCMKILCALLAQCFKIYQKISSPRRNGVSKPWSSMALPEPPHFPPPLPQRDAGLPGGLELLAPCLPAPGPSHMGFRLWS